MRKLDRYLSKEDELKDNLSKLYSIIWGQYSDQLQAEIKYVQNFESKNNAKDINWLSNELKRETSGIKPLGNKHVNYLRALELLLNMK